ncbi:MAG: hypothetical protein KGK07_05100 [Chloroflexota bacterium]|nr:hypothetical protein [Chloroflexota bacterium]
MKLLAGMVLAAALLAGVGLATRAGPASANNGPHGNYTLTTAACAGCHRAHTAVGTDLLKETNVYALCTTCHAGSVSTDVVHGFQTGSGLPLNGGGFEQANNKPVTSSHIVAGMPVSGTPASGAGTAWGSQNGDNIPVGDLGVGVQGTLECTSCHNPHGSTNYRILKDASNGYPYGPANASKHRWVPDNPDLLDWMNSQVVATVDDNFDYSFNPASDCVGTKCKMKFTSGISVVLVGGTPTTQIDTTKGMNAFCATCHKSYLTLSGSGAAPSTDATHYVYPGTQDALDGKGNVARYRHAVERTYGGSPQQPLRFAAEGTTPGTAGTVKYDAFSCLTCHYAHGSSSAATGFAQGVAPANDSALLFYDNRGVCISCHQTDKMAPTPTPAATSTPVPSPTP